MYLYLLCVLSDKIMKKKYFNFDIFNLLFIQEITDRCPMQCRLLIINSDYLNVCCCPRDISLAMYSDYPNVCRLDVLCGTGAWSDTWIYLGGLYPPRFYLPG